MIGRQGVQFDGVIRDEDGTPLHISDKHAAHVTVEDNTEDLVNGMLSQLVGIPHTLGADAVIDSYDITLSAGHPFSNNDFIVLAEDDRIFQAQALNVAGNVLTLDSPMDYEYPSAGTFVGKVINDLSVDGSTTRQVFSIGTPDTVTKNVHYRGLRINITDSQSMDDGKFGGTSALTRGIVFRIVRDDGRRYNITNIKSNGDFGITFDNKTYTDRGGGGGQYSVEFTWRIADDDGTVIEIQAGDRIEVIVQDDLRSLSSFRIWAFGHLES